MTTEQAEQIGQWMVRQGYASQDAVEKGLTEFRQRPTRQFSHVLLRMGLITPQIHATVLNKTFKAAFVDIERISLDPNVVKRLPVDVARRHLAIPVAGGAGGLRVAFADPTDTEAYRAISAAAGEAVQAVVGDEGAIQLAIQRHLGGATPASMDQEPEKDAFRFTDGELRDMAQDDVTKVRETVDQGPTVLLVNMMLMRAISSAASDIHIEPFEQSTIVRFRVDGSLYDWRNIDARAHTHIVSRIKVLSNLDTTERFKPQDGRFNARDLVGKDLDLRVSVLPTYYGEKVVMRLLDKTAARRSLGELGMDPQDLMTFERMIRRPWGMVVLTGPTGSGKTTTLYAALDRIRTVQKNIMTIEDPVEYQIDRIVQVQINERQGRTFGNVLRSSLRQDPDIIMVGEMRDEETAELGVRAALTGHLVMTTLHTNDSAGAIPRLVDMAVEPYLVASSVHGVVAQRLLRTVCSNCARPYQPPHELLLWANLDEEDIEDWKLLHGEGCERCNRTGYLGRVGIYELMPVSDAIRDLTVENAGTTPIRKQAVTEGTRLLRESASVRVAAGISTLDELVAATAL
jgi:type IV pilus assembly protein PilB